MARAERFTTVWGLFAAFVPPFATTQAKKIALIVPRDPPTVHNRERAEALPAMGRG
jgi:hypothetical protein